MQNCKYISENYRYRMCQDVSVDSSSVIYREKEKKARERDWESQVSSSCLSLQYIVEHTATGRKNKHLKRNWEPMCS